MASIFENVYNTFNNLKNKAQTGIQNWAQTNPQTAQRIINAPQQIRQAVSSIPKSYVNTYQKVSPYVPFAPKVTTPQQIQQNTDRMYQAVNRFQPLAPTKNVAQNILSTPYNFVAGLSNQLIYNPKTKQSFPSSPIRQLPNQKQLLNMAKSGDIQGVAKAWAPSTYSVGAGFVLGGSGVKSNKLLNVGDIKEIGAIANRASKNWMTEAGKADIAQMAKDENLVDIILGDKYKAPMSELKKIPLVKKINTLFGIGMEDYRGAPKIQPGLSTKPLGGAVQVGGKTPGGIPPQELDPVQRIISAIKEAKPVRGQQEALYTAERGKRISQFAQIGQNVSGEKGFYKQLGALEGQLPRAEFETLRKTLDQPTVDSLFNKVKEANITEFEKVTAGNALGKLLGQKGSTVPTKNELSLLNEVFGKEFTEAVLSKRPTLQKLADAGYQIFNIPRSLMFGVGDLSSTLLQNAMFAARHPVITAKNFVKQLKMFASEDAFQASQQELRQRPNYLLSREGKLSLTDVGSDLSKREETFMSNWAEKIPGLGKIVKGTGRAYTGFMNRMRMDVFDGMIRDVKQIGLDPTTDKKLLSDITGFINNATGRGSLGGAEKYAEALNTYFISPRKMAATFQMMNPVNYVNPNINPMVRKEYLRTMLSFIGAGTSVLGLAKLAGADVSTDPTNSDFGKIKIGNTRINFFGPYQGMAVLIARLISGKMTSSTTGKEMTLGEGYKPTTRLDIAGRYFTQKEHPTISLLAGMAQGQDWSGQPFNVPAEVLNRFTPMLLSDGYDLYKEHGPVGLLGLIPAALGVSTQTYGRQQANLETTPSGKTTLKTKPVGGLSEDIISKVTNKPQTNIPKKYQEPLVNVRSRQTQVNIFKEKIKTLSPEEKRDYILKSLKNGTVTREDLINIINKKSTGTAENTSIKFLESQPKKERATYVKSLISGKSPEEKLAIVKNLIKKGIIDKEVLMLLKGK